MTTRKENPGLFRIVVILLVAGAAVYGVIRGSRWFNQEFIVAGLEAAAPENLARARALVAEGNTAEAVELLRPIVARLQHEEFTPEALMLLADIALGAGNAEEALGHLERAARGFTGGALHPKAGPAYARLLEDTGKVGEALELYAELRDTAQGPARASGLSGLARQAERDDDLLAHRRGGVGGRVGQRRVE